MFHSSPYKYLFGMGYFLDRWKEYASIPPDCLVTSSISPRHFGNSFLTLKEKLQCKRLTTFLNPIFGGLQLLKVVLVLN